MQHLYLEFKLRFFYFLLSFFGTLLTSYFYQLEILYIIGKPFLELQQKFVFIDLTEAFYTILYICSILTICITIPFFFYHLWSYFLPSCYVSERKIINNFLLLLFVLVCFEFFFVYIYIFPKICEFLLSFESKKSGLIMIQLSARIQSYVSLLINFFLFLLAVFQIPFLFLGLYYKKMCTSYDLCKNRKIVFFTFLLISAFISPPDILSELIITLLFFFMYEFLICIGFFFLQNK